MSDPRVQFVHKSLHRYNVVVNGEIRGDLEFRPDTREYASWFEFEDHRTKVYGTRGGLGRKEAHDIIKLFYKASYDHVAFIHSLDAKFDIALWHHKIPHKHNSDVYFFQTMEDYTTAQLLV